MSQENDRGFAVLVRGGELRGDGTSPPPPLPSDSTPSCGSGGTMSKTATSAHCKKNG
jgi:hypothetical protein